jgi:hypothetical protein
VETELGKELLWAFRQAWKKVPFSGMIMVKSGACIRGGEIILRFSWPILHGYGRGYKKFYKL